MYLSIKITVCEGALICICLQVQLIFCVCLYVYVCMCTCMVEQQMCVCIVFEKKINASLKGAVKKHIHKIKLNYNRKLS